MSEIRVTPEMLEAGWRAIGLNSDGWKEPLTNQALNAAYRAMAELDPERPQPKKELSREERDVLNKQMAQIRRNWEIIERQQKQLYGGKQA